jgi:hypothetical protein
MHLILRRYSRSGAAPKWFYSLLAVGFVGLAIWAAAERDWIVLGIAAAMVLAAAAVSRFSVRLSEALAASRRSTDEVKGGTDE